MNVKDDRRLRKRRRGKYASPTEATLGTLNAPRSLRASEARGRKTMPFLAEVSAEGRPEGFCAASARARFT